MRLAPPLLLVLFSTMLLVACNDSKSPETNNGTAGTTQSAPSAESQSASAEQSAAMVAPPSSEALSSQPAASTEQSDTLATQEQSGVIVAPTDQSEPAVHLALTPASDWIDYDLSAQGIPLSIKGPKNLKVDSQQQEGAIRAIVGNVDENAGVMIMMSIDSYPAQAHTETMKQFEGLRKDLAAKGSAALGEQAQQMNVKIVQNKKDGVITYGSKNGKAIIIIIAPIEKGGVKGGSTATVIGNSDVVTEKLAYSVFDSLKNVRAVSKK